MGFSIINPPAMGVPHLWKPPHVQLMKIIQKTCICGSPKAPAAEDPWLCTKEISFMASCKKFFNIFQHHWPLSQFFHHFFDFTRVHPHWGCDRRTASRCLDLAWGIDGAKCGWISRTPTWTYHLGTRSCTNMKWRVAHLWVIGRLTDQVSCVPN